MGHSLLCGPLSLVWATPSCVGHSLLCGPLPVVWATPCCVGHFLLCGPLPVVWATSCCVSHSLLCGPLPVSVLCWWKKTISGASLCRSRKTSRERNQVHRIATPKPHDYLRPRESLFRCHYLCSSEAIIWFAHKTSFPRFLKDWLFRRFVALFPAGFTYKN